jgi:hypothetical protein
MLDILYISITILFFLSCWGLIALCRKLMEG